jgi:hypothetical protein
VAFTDDDVIPGEDWLEQLVALDAAAELADIVGGRIVPWFRDARPSASVARVFPETANGFCGVDHGPRTRLLSAEEYVHGANFVIRRRTAGQLRFDTSIGHTPLSQGGGDDTEFIDRARRHGHSVWWHPGLSVQHYVEPKRLTMAYLKRYTIDKATYDARTFDFGDGLSLLGIPLWLVRERLACRVRQWRASALGREEEALSHLRRGWTLQGLTEGRRILATSEDRRGAAR